MAYNATNEERTELFNISKGNRGDAVVGTKIVNKNTNNVAIDIRQFYTADDGELRATQKGVRFNAENLLEVMQSMLGALEADELDDLKSSIEDIQAEEDAE